VKLARLTASLLVVLALSGTSYGARIFLSTAGPTGPDTVGDPSADLANGVNLTLQPGQASSLYIWAIPTAPRNIIGVALDLATSSNAVSATGAAVYNDVLDAVLEQQRWNGASAGTSPPPAGFLVKGMNMASVDRRGIRNSAGLRDGYVDAGTGAWLIGKVDLTAGQPGTAQLTFSVGEKLIAVANNAGGGTGGAELVNFGPSSDTQNVDGGVIGAASSTADATITVVPEPSAIALAAMGLLGLLTCIRRRK
jgi:hypothetical protein